MNTKNFFGSLLLWTVLGQTAEESLEQGDEVHGPPYAFITSDVMGDCTADTTLIGTLTKDHVLTKFKACTYAHDVVWT